MFQAVKLLMKISESFVCRVCADNDVNTVFVPCGHIVCCQTCSSQMDCCPVCKCHVQTTQTVFLPYTKPVFEINLSCQTISCAWCGGRGPVPWMNCMKTTTSQKEDVSNLEQVILHSLRKCFNFFISQDSCRQNAAFESVSMETFELLRLNGSCKWIFPAVFFSSVLKRLHLLFW